MHIYGVRQNKIELEPVATEVISRAGLVPVVSVRGAKTPPALASARVTRAASAFFEYARQSGPVVSAPPKGVSPTVMREKATGRIRTFQREIVIRFKPTASQKTRKSILDKYGFKIRHQNPFVKDQWTVYDEDRNHLGEALLEVANDWAGMDDVIFATPNFVSEYTRHALPKPHAEQWHLSNKGKGGQKKAEDVAALKAWGITRGKGTIVVAVLDDGVDIDHPNLKSRIAPGGRDFFVSDDHPEHDNPRPKLFHFPFDQMTGNDIHGTPCAGVIAAAGKKKGAVGIAPVCKILPIKIFHADDFASDERVADAIRYAAAHADILSCSWSGGATPDIEQALEDAGSIGRGGKGCAVFCASGNEFQNRVGFPARDQNAVAVGASTDQGTRADYSNFGPEIAMVAPSSGGIKSVFTTDVSINNRGFNTGKVSAGGKDGLHTNDFGGTSSATPLAAGVAALVLSVRPKLNRSELRDILTESADKIGTGYDAKGHSREFGFGRVNALRALELARKA
jgi:subtilisin family serine protease